MRTPRLAQAAPARDSSAWQASKPSTSCMPAPAAAAPAARARSHTSRYASLISSLVIVVAHQRLGFPGGQGVLPKESHPHLLALEAPVERRALPAPGPEQRVSSAI